MGLLSRIEAGTGNSTPPASSQKGGLLSRVSKLEQSTLSFFEFIQKNSLTYCAIFLRINTDYVIFRSVEFDGASIASSVSTFDFWEGTLNKNSWQIFSREDGSINSLLQFFPKEKKDDINAIAACKFSDKIILLADENKFISEEKIKKITSEINLVNFKKDFTFQTNISQTNKISYKFIIDYLNASETFIETVSSSIISAEIKQKMKEGLQAEITSRLFLLFKNQKIISQNLSKMQISFSSNEKISGDCLKNFLSINLYPVLNSCVKQVSYEN